MDKLFVLVIMLFCHIVDDYYLQGILSSLKQEKWWKENYPERMYKKDYIVALLMHSFSWAFMVMLPIAIYYHFLLSANFYILLFANCVVHMLIDDQKANRLRINLIVDQAIHIIQICVTYAILVM